MTETDFQAWLDSDDAMRCVLVEARALVAGVETLRYLSTENYVTGMNDTPANVAYWAVVSGGLKITEKMSLEGSASLSFGDIELDNSDGSLDEWLMDVWDGRPVEVFMGDVRWPRTEFRKLFSGTQARFGARDRGTLNLALRDKLQRLNTPVTDLRLGGIGDNKDRIIPVCFGECHNVEPLLINPVTLTYQVHTGAIEDIIEVRDNGVPVAYVGDLANGKFSLPAQPSGLVTASIQGDKFAGVYTNRIAPIVRRLATGFGKAADRFAEAEVDGANFAAFDAAHPQPVGLYLYERANVLKACADLAGSVGAQMVPAADGLLRMLKLGPVGLAPLTPTNPSHMAERSLRVADRPPVQAAVKIAYCKNWTVQKNLQTGIPEAHKNLFALEWLTRTATDAVVAERYRLSEEPVDAETMLLVEVDALAEATRRLALWSVQRTVFMYTGMPTMMLQQLGSGQLLTDGRFGLAAGKPGQIVGITRDWLEGRITLEVLV